METGSSSFEGTFDLSVYNSFGQLVVRESDYFFGNEIPAQQLPVGIYILQLINEGEIFQVANSFVKKE